MVQPVKRWPHPGDLKPDVVREFLKKHEPERAEKADPELIRVLSWALPLYARTVIESARDIGETENAKLRAEVATYEKRIPELCAEYLGKLRASDRQSGEMRTLLELIERTGCCNDLGDHPNGQPTCPCFMAEDFLKERKTERLNDGLSKSQEKRVKAQRVICEKCDESPCMCAANAHHGMTGD